VKDYNAHGELQTDMTFMTNADVPLLTLQNIVDNPKNPFTGNALTSEYKTNGVYITTNHLFMARDHNGQNTFKINKNQWIYVHDNIFNTANWERYIN
jgi:hypothetical protein